MSTTTDAQLVGEYLAGDSAELGAIYDRYGDKLFDTAAAMSRDRHDAPDMTQDVFVIAAERMSQLRDPRPAQELAVRNFAQRGASANWKEAQCHCDRFHGFRR
jgi:DNA-directed RNA polymerase specialized sigma24 family protein